MSARARRLWRYVVTLAPLISLLLVGGASANWR